MASFYGGSPGLSMMIVKTYLTKEAMISDFKKSTCKVGIGECVCIDSGLNDGEHGNIYRRTVNAEEYEYVGNMAGPMGPGVSFAATIKIDETSSTSISDQINQALGISTNNPITETLKLRSVLCEDKQGLQWIYSYSYKENGEWVRVSSHDRYIISSRKPSALSSGGLWLCTQEAPDSGLILKL